MKITLKPLADMREAGAPRDPYTTSNAMFRTVTFITSTLCRADIKRMHGQRDGT
jgi:hypothetical protein